MNSPLLGNLITKLFLLLIGLIFLIPPAYKLYSYSVFRYQSIAVYGIIDRSLKGGNLGGRPLVKYKDTQGNVYEIRSEAKTHWFYAPKKGEKIKVLFFKNNSQQAIVDSIFHYVVLPLFFSIIGGIVIFYVLKNIWQEFNDYINLSNR